jgi:hypothetical protein
MLERAQGAFYGVSADVHVRGNATVRQRISLLQKLTACFWQSASRQVVSRDSEGRVSSVLAFPYPLSARSTLSMIRVSLSSVRRHDIALLLELVESLIGYLWDCKC